MFYIKALDSKKFFRTRIAIIGAYRANIFSLSETLALILPDRISPSRKNLTQKLRNFIREKAHAEVAGYMNIHHPHVMESISGKDSLHLIRQIFIDDEYNARKFLKEGSVVIDAGANIGTFSIYAHILTKGGTIFSFEPVKNVYQTLIKNTAPYKGIQTYNQALGASEGTSTIHTSTEYQGINALDDSYLAEFNKNLFNGSETVSVTTIDSFVTSKHIPRIDFIKIDTEGYEKQILEGARKTIERDRPVIAMSAYHEKGDEVALPAILRSINPAYTCVQEHRSEKDLVCFVKD